MAEATTATSPEVNKDGHEMDKPGHINNLDPEQTEKLKGIWKRFLDTVSDAGGAAKKQAAVDTSGASSTSPDTGKAAATKSKGKGDGEKAEEAEAEEKAGLGEVLSQYGPEEFQKAFWRYVRNEDPDGLMLRYLRARSWDVSKAFNMLANALKWRLDNDVAGIIERGEEGLCKEEGIKKNFGMAKCYFHGTDRGGRPMIYVRVKKHRASHQTTEEMFKFMVLNMETSRTLLATGSGQETTSCLFDMTGLGLSNVDWDTAGMVIKVFQSAYPETLGHAVIWNAPTLFNGVWKIISGMLDPVVREKIHFASGEADVLKVIDPKHLEKEYGGSSAWHYQYSSPVAGENDHMKDAETKQKRQEAYDEACRKFESATTKWIGGDAEAYEERRKKIVKELEVRQMDLDPYIRGKTMFMRDGTVVGDGRVIWSYDHGHKEEFGTNTNEWAKELSIEEPAERPFNKGGDDEITLDSAEDTVSSTDDSEEEAYLDTHHRHHSAVAVGFAKFGHKTGNVFSKLTPGPSLEKKEEARRQKKHQEHEARRAAKIERKRKQLEAQKAREAESEEQRMKREEEEEAATEASYSAYLARMGNLTLAAGHGVSNYVPAVLGGNYLARATDTTSSA